MKTSISTLILALCIFSARAQKSVLQPGATLQKISSQFKFTEGPAVDKDGNVLFTDQPNDAIWKYDFKTKQLSIFMQPSGRSNGLFITNKGELLACADERNELWKIDKNGNKEVLVKLVNGKRPNGPNDVWADPYGGIYFTDPFYLRDYWDHKEQQQEENGIYFRRSFGEVTQEADSLVKPNGIVGNYSKKILYMSDIGAAKIYRFKIDKDGSLKDKTLFYEEPCDGMTLDRKGNLYLTGNGVTVVSKNGVKIDHIAIPEPWTANVTLAGPNRKTLFITASKSVYTMDVKYKGVKN